jgi:pimeloyl-ACP methyl ester carboxylesterase
MRISSLIAAAKRLSPLALAIALLAIGRPSASYSQTFRLEDGRLLTGAYTNTTGVADNPERPSNQSGEIATKPIAVIDDELRRVYVAKGRIAEILEQAPDPLVTIKPWQNPSTGVGRLVSVGPSLGITPFDEYGRRIYEMQLSDGPLAVVQGITELTPRYARVQSLQGPQRSINWEMMIATSSIPADTLAKIIHKAIPQDQWQARLQAVTFYAQANRFPEARRELEQIIEEFPDKKDLQNEVITLRRLGAQQLFRELELRRSAGQHKLVGALLDRFPLEEVSGETLIELRKVIADYDLENGRIEQIRKALQQTVSAISDPDHRGLAAPIAEEVVKELTHNNVNRLTPFAQLIDDPGLTAEEKTALALTGWLLGGDDAKRELPLAISLIKVRDAVMRYFREPMAKDRQVIFESIQSLEGATVEQLAKLVARMKPPYHDPQFMVPEGGYLQLSAPGQTEDGDFNYLVQLPPEYDPYELYPTLVVLNGAYNSPEQELDFWAGTPADSGDKKTVRRGHAMRHGYITIAVDWQKPHQYEYEYSSREHLAVLTCLRDACRRLSIDTDKVFLTGHDIGGEAAWDMAQAHPDLWAGGIPFVPRFEGEQKYIAHYWENAEYLPMYYVAGELDGRTIAQNALVWNKYLRLRRFDATLVEFQGRGHEPFHDEIITLFDWMALKRRTGPPKEFVCHTLRPWDNFFWWLECGEFPDHLMVYPTDWGSRRITPAAVVGKVQNDNRLAVETKARLTTIWLAPDIVDFSKPIRVSFNGRSLPTRETSVKPDPYVLLEDVRTRADRQRPFWAKIDVP